MVSTDLDHPYTGDDVFSVGYCRYRLSSGAICAGSPLAEAHIGELADPPVPSGSYRQRTDNPPTDEELDEWVKGLKRADYL